MACTVLRKSVSGVRVSELKAFILRRIFADGVRDAVRPGRVKRGKTVLGFNRVWKVLYNLVAEIRSLDGEPLADRCKG